MGLNSASNYNVQVFAEADTKPEVGKPLTANVLFVVIRDAKERCVITSPGGIATSLGLKEPDGGKRAALNLSMVTAVEVDGDFGERRLIHGEFTFKKKQKLELSDSPTRSVKYGIVVLVPKLEE